MLEKGRGKPNLTLGRLLTPELVAILGAIIFLIQAVIFAHIRLPNLDEGSYLYKGYLLARGVYTPFQPYGFWINKMYLSFFIWGWLQELFAPGLLAPRYFAVLLSVLALLGLWIASRRMGNRWLAAAAVWVVALNPALISKYSTATAQVLIICMITWVLVLSLGADRPTWQIIAGAILAALMVLTRENMVFTLPLLCLYIFWQHGRKKGLLALGAVIVVIVVGHLIYWPDIMHLWVAWLPSQLQSIIGLGSANADTGKSAMNIAASDTLGSRLHSLSLAIRMHYVPVIGSLIVLLVWPKKNLWRTSAHFRAAVFLAVLFFVLLIAHGWASLGNGYCVYCFQDYIAFFGNVGLLLVVVSIGAWNKAPAVMTRVISITLLLMVTSAIGFSLFSQIGDGLLRIPIPRIRGGRIISGWANLWQVLSNKFHIPYDDARAYVPVAAGLVAGLLFLVILLMIYQRHPIRRTISRGLFFPVGFLIIGTLLSPMLNWPFDVPLCGNDVVAAYEKIGSQLASIAPPGSKIYLDGTRSAIPLLYAPGVIILPPQLNDYNSYKIGGDPNLVLKEGFWNRQIALAWRASADVFVIEGSRMSDWRDYLTTDSFDRIPSSPNPLSCSPDAEIYLFKRK
jgi:hypothetical protein